MRIYTIGYTKKSAEEFFETLKENKVKNLIDVRLNNTSHLASFAKKDHLIYLLKEICDINYHEDKNLAPTKEILDNYKKDIIDWNEYEEQFIPLLKTRNIINSKNINLFNNACLLCAEPTPDKCHRRLVAEYLQKNLKDIQIKHL